MKNLALSSFFIMLSLLSFSAYSEITCTGTIDRVYKWRDSDTFSVMLSSANKWIKLPSKSDESMALLAFVSNKQIKFYWSASDVTSCADGWVHNRVFQGWWSVEK